MHESENEVDRFSTLYRTDFTGDPVQIKNRPVLRKSQRANQYTAQVEKTGKRDKRQEMPLVETNPIVGLYGLEKNVQSKKDIHQAENQKFDPGNPRWETIYKNAYLNSLLTKTPSIKTVKPEIEPTVKEKLVDTTVKQFSTEYAQQYKQKLGSQDIVDLFISGSLEHQKGTSKASHHIPGYSGFIPYSIPNRGLIE